jgi:hypothetical protein
VSISRDPCDRFAEEAALFELWARSRGAGGEAAAREGLLRITRLYLAALDLPRAEGSGDYYGQVSNPLAVPPEEPGIGSVADDIADIYRDIVTGLREYRAGRTMAALWEWEFGFRQHWGDHATGAIRALHAWLAEHAPEHLGSPPLDRATDRDRGEPG